MCSSIADAYDRPTERELQEDTNMTMPGFTADASLMKINQYGATGPIRPQPAGSVVPQLSATCIIDQDGTAAAGHIVYQCHLILDGVEVHVPREVLQ
jgi:hypothetical protein